MKPSESVQVEFSAAPEYVAVARRVAEVVGARARLAAGALEELQIAVSEVCNRLVTASQGAPSEASSLRVLFRLEAERVVVEVGGTGSGVQRAVAGILDDQFAAFLIRRLVDGAACIEGPEGAALRLEKVRQKRAP